MRFCSLNTFRCIVFQGIVFHPSIGRVVPVFIAYWRLVVPLPSTLPCLRQPILWLSQRRSLLRPSFPPSACGCHLLRWAIRAYPTRGEPEGALRRSWVPFAVA